MERKQVIREFGTIVQRMHETALEDWMHNPWVEEVLARGRWGDAYHAPPQMYPHLIASAASERPDLQSLLDRVLSFISERMFAFGDAPATFIHTDLHFRNVVVDAGRVTGLVDFEGSRIGRRDAELDMLFRSLATDVQASASRFPGAVTALAAAYPDLLSDTHLLAKLEVYEALWQLVQAHHWHPGGTWTIDPGIGWNCSFQASLPNGWIE